jgi:hypothetical protein
MCVFAIVDIPLLLRQKQFTPFLVEVQGEQASVPMGVLIYWLQSRRLDQELGTFKHSEMCAM